MSLLFQLQIRYRLWGGPPKCPPFTGDLETPLRGAGASSCQTVWPGKAASEMPGHKLLLDLIIDYYSKP
jgi:hypothetical protein